MQQSLHCLAEASPESCMQEQSLRLLPSCTHPCQSPAHQQSHIRCSSRTSSTHLISIGACAPPPPMTCANPLNCVGLGPSPGAAPSAAPAAAAPAKPPGAAPPAELFGSPNPHPVPLPRPGFCVFWSRGVWRAAALLGGGGCWA
jgi:hypothetical protein